MKRVKIRPRKACRYPNLRSFEWVSYDKVGGLYSGKLGIRSEARASDLRSYPGLRWKRIKLHLYEGTKVSTLRGPAQLADLQEGALCVPHPLISHSQEKKKMKNSDGFGLHDPFTAPKKYLYPTFKQLFPQKRVSSAKGV